MFNISSKYQYYFLSCFIVVFLLCLTNDNVLHKFIQQAYDNNCFKSKWNKRRDEISCTTKFHMRQ